METLNHEYEDSADRVCEQFDAKMHLFLQSILDSIQRETMTDEAVEA